MKNKTKETELIKIIVKGLKNIRSNRCPYCGKKMFNVIDSKTKEISKYSWRCNCKKFPKDLVMCKG